MNRMTSKTTIPVTHDQSKSFAGHDADKLQPMTALEPVEATTPPDWVPVKERRPAPGSLLIVQAFVNTRDIDGGTDNLADVDAGSDWLRRAGLFASPGPLQPAELRLSRDVRESVRELIARNGRDHESAPDDLRPIEMVLSGQDLRPADRLRLAIDPVGHVTARPGAPGNLSSGLLGLILVIRDAQRDGLWSRLKICGNADCRWAFYDRSHSRMGAWCEMASCGNIIKNRNLRARRRGGSRTIG